MYIKCKTRQNESMMSEGKTWVVTLGMVCDWVPATRMLLGLWYELYHIMSLSMTQEWELCGNSSCRTLMARALHFSVHILYLNQNLLYKCFQVWKPIWFKHSLSAILSLSVTIFRFSFQGYQKNHSTIRKGRSLLLLAASTVNIIRTCALQQSSDTALRIIRVQQLTSLGSRIKCNVAVAYGFYPS